MNADALRNASQGRALSLSCPPSPPFQPFLVAREKEADLPNSTPSMKMRRIRDTELASSYLLIFGSTGSARNEESIRRYRKGEMGISHNLYL